MECKSGRGWFLWPRAASAFVFQGRLGIWERWGNNILQAPFSQSLLGSIQPKSISHRLYRVCIARHTLAHVCVVWQLFMERNNHFYVQKFRHEHLQAIHEPGRSEKPAVTRRKPEHQNNLRTEINPINKCRNVICGFAAHFSALHSHHWITLLRLFCAVN